MSMENRTRELINGRIDGTLSPEDVRELESRLAGDAAARSLLEELGKLCADLDEVDAVEPPGDLHSQVLSRIGKGESAPPAVDEAAWMRTFSSWLAFPPVRYAMSFGAGMLLTYVLISSGRIDQQTFDDVTSLVGTISGESRNGPAVTERISISLADLTGTVNVRQEGSLFVLDFNLTSPAETEVVAEFDNRDVWFNGFAQLESRGTSIDAGEGRFSLRIQGQRRYAVYMRRAGNSDANLTLAFRTSGRTIYERQLLLGTAQR